MDGKLAQAIASIEAGNRQTAASLLAKLLREDPRNESAWLWLAAALTDPDRRRYCLEKALAINPANPVAQEGLERLRSVPTGAPQAPEEPEVQTYEIPEESEIEIIPKSPVDPGRIAQFEIPTAPSRRAGSPDALLSPAEYTRSDYVITVGWVTPRRSADRVVLLEPDALLVANPDFEYLSRIRQQLVVGPVPHQLLGLTPRIYTLDQIEQVVATARGRRLHLRYRERRRTRYAVVRFANRDECNDAFHQLQRRLGADFIRNDREISRWLVGLALAALVAAILAGTTLLAGAADRTPAVVVAAGGLLLLGTLIWLIPYLAIPPLRMTIERTNPPTR